MRYVALKGLDDGLRFDFSRDISVIAFVMEKGKYRPDLIYDWEVTGEELTAVAERFRIALPDGILPNGRYVLTAYDW